jgi:hypothetical protein
VLLRVKEQRNILHEISKRKSNQVGHILRRNCLVRQVIEGKIKGRMEVTGRRGRRRRNLLDDLKDRRGYSHLKEEALDRIVWRDRFGGGFEPVVRQTAKLLNEIQCIGISLLDPVASLRVLLLLNKHCVISSFASKNSSDSFALVFKLNVFAVVTLTDFIQFGIRVCFPVASCSARV